MNTFLQKKCLDTSSTVVTLAIHHVPYDVMMQYCLRPVAFISIYFPIG